MNTLKPKTRKPPFAAVLLCCFSLACLASSAEAVDLRKGVPADAHLAVYGKYNPERDYQGQYYEEVLQTIEDEKIVPRFVEIITQRMDPEDLAKAEAFFAEIKTAIGPVGWEKFENCEEVAIAQKFHGQFNQSLVIMRLSSSGSEELEVAAQNLFGLAEKYSAGKVTAVTSEQDNASVSTLGNIPEDSPVLPVVARLDDLFLFSTSPQLIQEGLSLLQSDTGESKFDDPRFAKIIASLPEAEDSLVIFDGKELFSKLRQIGDTIREKAAEGRPEKQEKVERIAGLVELLIDELSVPDYEITVEFTEGNRNHSKAIGSWLEGSEDTLLGTLLIGGEPLDNWQSWIPADAVSYSLTSGKSASPFYQRLTELLRQHIPELNQPLDRFEEVQEQIGVHLDRDILQSFSGGCVSINLTGTDATGQTTHQSVLALRCESPERIKELLHRAVDKLNEFPAVQPQQVHWQETEDLPGFEKLNALFFGMLGVEPVVGFRDGWMMVGSNPEAVQRVLDVRAGTSPSIASSEHFQKFGLEIEGPVSSLSYSNVAENIHHAAQVIRQVGAVAPMFLAMAGAEANPEDLKPVQEMFALLPSLATVVEKFDFMEESLSVTQPGDAPRTYVRQGVMLIRAPSAADSLSVE